MPFEIPDSWAWVKLPQIAQIELGKTLNKNTDEGEDVQYLCSINVQWEGIKLDFVKRARFTTNEQEKYRLRKNDLLICEGGEAGRSSVWNHNDIMYYQNALHRVRFIKGINAYFFKAVFDRYSTMGLISKYCVGVTIKHLTSSALNAIFFPMPPLFEQKRIVSRIEELFDQIAAIEQNQSNIYTLYEEFKKRTLTLAIQGKLVPQNPNDEPASVLLGRIRAEKKAKLGKKYVDSYIYKGDANCYYEHITGRAQDELVEIPFDIPDNWTWAKLLDLGGFSSGKTPDMSEPTYWQNGNVQWFTSKDMKTKYLTESQLKITELAAGDMTLYPANTLLWVVRSGILKSSLPICILKQPATINQDIKAYQLYQSDMIDYVYYMLKGMEAIILDNYVKRITTVHSLKFDELISKLAIPIPPLAEQKRIVAKINEVFVML